jgi:hypothetical protein
MSVYLDKLKHRGPFGEFPEISIDSWPDPRLHAARPGDEIGASILAYVSQWSSHPSFPPDGPWDTRTGTINLPDLDEPRPDTDPVPRYKLKSAGFVGCVLFNAGSETSFPGWPVDPFNLEAVNTSAELVLAYQLKHGVHRKLPGAPHSGGQLRFPNPALQGSPITAVPRWSGAAS